MDQEIGKFKISYLDQVLATSIVEKDGIFLGRLDTCDIVLDHKAVSRIHAGISFKGGRYLLSNLSSSNILTINGRKISPQKGDVLADGDTIQIGPFTIEVKRVQDEIELLVESRFTEQLPIKTGELAARAVPDKRHRTSEGVLKVFWSKRNRQKEDWGTRLRPTERPKPGKAMFNWRPTADLRRPWRLGLFIWSFLIIGAIGVFAFLRFPGTYAPKPLSNPHTANLSTSAIAIRSNAGSCTTCHTPDEPLENACIKCHQASEFHASNTKAHQESGITCSVCHKEHQGADYDIKATAISSCAECHNDRNKSIYNGRTVRTAHNGSYGYPAVNGVWQWKGVYREVAAAIPEINSSATGDKDEQARLSRHFHTVHVARLKAPEGLMGDANGFVSCSTCHKSFDPVDRTTPRETCAACHTTAAGATDRDQRFGVTSANCISCHIQHPFSGGRWKEFLTEDALKRRRDAIVQEISKLNGK